MQSRKFLRVATRYIIGLLIITIAAGPLLSAKDVPTASGETDETTYYLLTDHLGSVDVVLDEQGNVVERRDYLPYGQERFVHEELNAPETDYGFTGKELDSETGLNYYGARYYDPLTGRFIQMDPLLLNLDQMSQKQRNAFLSDPQNLNAYTYVQNNPLRYTDPSGMYGKDVHLYLTNYLATKAGFSDLNAFTIGLYDQMTDSDPATGPWTSRETRQAYHFATPEQLGKLHHQALESMDHKDIGVFLHTYQDSFSHDGYGPTIGHVLDGHKPDKTYLAVEKAMEMAKGTFFHLRTFNLMEMNITDTETIEVYNTESNQIWESMAANIEEYLSFEIKQLSEIGEQVNYKEDDAEVK